MLTSLLVALCLAPLPATQGQPVGPAAPSTSTQRKTISIGCNDPKWLSRKAINKQLGELAGFELYDLLWKGVAWLNTQPVEGAGAKGVEGRDVGSTALVGLALLGTGANIQAGAGKLGLRQSAAALGAWQQAETGAIGDPTKSEFLLDHTLACLTLGETYFSYQVPEHEAPARLAFEALLAARGEDGLWHIEGKPDGPVDPLVTSLAGYALFVARAARLEVPDKTFEPIFAWTTTVGERAEFKEGEVLAREDALLYAGALCARLFSADALERSLADDEAVKKLSGAVAAQIPPPPTADAQWKSPPRLSEPDFAFLATLGLYQSDNQAWGRSSRWLAAMFLADAEKEGDVAGTFAEGVTGRLPGGRLGVTALRILAMQSGVRELSLSVFAQ